MADEPAASGGQIQDELIDNDITGADTPARPHWTRHLEAKVVASAFVALIANGLRAALSLLN